MRKVGWIPLILKMEGAAPCSEVAAAQRFKQKRDR